MMKGAKPSSSCVHNRFAGALSECIVELVAMVQAEIVADKGLAAVFVDSLQDLYIYSPGKGEIPLTN